MADRPGVDMDFEAEVCRRLPLFGPKVNFCHWGAHDATNQYANVPNVILAGTLFMRTSHYQALGRFASAHPSSRGRFNPEEITKVILGEHRHMILQSLCRGATRKSVGDGCPPSLAYIIASCKSGIAQELQSIFPSAKLHPWQPVKKDLKGKVAEAVHFVTQELFRRPCGRVSFREVMDHPGWTSSKDFKRRIRRHEDFIDALVAEGIEEAGRGKHPTGFERITGRHQ